MVRSWVFCVKPLTLTSSSSFSSVYSYLYFGYITIFKSSWKEQSVSLLTWLKWVIQRYVYCMLYSILYFFSLLNSSFFKLICLFLSFKILIIHYICLVSSLLPPPYIEFVLFRFHVNTLPRYVPAFMLRAFRFSLEYKRS